MSNDDGVVRVVASVLLALLLTMFTTLALDMAVPAPQNPYEVLIAPQEYAGPTDAQNAEWEARYVDIESRLEQGEITQDQAQVEMTALFEQQNAAMEESYATTPDSAYPQSSDAYTRAMTGRYLTLALVGIVLMGLLLWAGVEMGRRGLPLSAVPLLAGAMMGSFAMGAAGGSDTGWGRLVIAGVVVAAAVFAGQVAFRPSETVA